MINKKPLFENEKGRNLQFINSFYTRPRWSNGKMTVPDSLGIVYRDEDTGEKFLDIQYQPNIDFYMSYEDVEIPHHLRHISKDLVEKCTCKFNDLPLTLAKTAGDDMVKDYYDTIKVSPYKAKRKYHYLPYIFNSDMDIEDFWKGKFLDNFDSKADKLTKAYYDIEVDSVDYIGFPDENIAPCEVNAITYVNAEFMTCHTYLLRNRNNPQIEVEERRVNELIQYMKDTLRDDFKYHIYFYDYELDLIADFFAQVNKDKPDFCAAWNARFDALTLINRIKQLGGDPAEIICHPDVPQELRFAYFTADDRNPKPCDKGDSFNCASYTMYIDQLIIFAALRKGQGDEESYSLNHIAKKQLGDEKLDYSDTSTIQTLAYDDYRKFVAYNIKDVFLLYEIEKKNDDFDMLYSLAKITRTRISKTMRKTVSLKNLAAKFYYDQGYIMGNNTNGRIDDDGDSAPTEKFDGALVADPALNGFNGMLINGKRSKYVYQKVIDYDLSALYPSIIRAFNIDTTTQYGRLLIDGIEPTKEHDPAMGFVDKLTSGNYIRLGHEYYGLPTATELARQLIQKQQQ